MTRDLIDTELKIIEHKLEFLRKMFVNRHDGYSEGYVTAMDEALLEINERIILNSK